MRRIILLLLIPILILTTTAPAFASDNTSVYYTGDPNSSVMRAAGLVYLEIDRPGGASQPAPQPLPDQHSLGGDGGGAGIDGGKGEIVKDGFGGRIGFA